MNNFDINLFFEKLYKKNFGKNLFLFVMGLLLGALAVNLFFEKYNIVSSGSSGLAILLANYSSFDISLLIFIISLICLILGLIFFGYEYAAKMLAVTFIYPLFVACTSFLTKYIDLEDTSLFLIVVFGGAMMGFSSGLIRKSNYSPGGFCVLIDLMHKYLNISIGTSTLIIYLIIIIFSGNIMGLENAIYASISLIVSAYIIDKVIIGISDNKVFYIVTTKPLDVRDYIVEKLNYSVTVINARGGYTNKKRKMLMCVVPTIEYVKLKELISEIDNKAFFLIVDTYESSVKKNCKNM